ncbi:MAG TPA: hypothetical protein VNZ94_06795 [Xanthobacteraceae bacterium]|nr:hypothetical protein [Xanthobacteraceae bacterium]
MRAFVTALFVIVGGGAALADAGFSVVIPNRPDVPVVINGCDASYAVIESDWGLAKNVHIQPTIYGCRPPLARPVGHYYPSAGRVPGYGRHEIEPPANRKLPPKAESFSRSWSVQSATPNEQTDVPSDPPTVILAPGSVPGSID